MTDISVTGGMGFYQLHGRTKAGNEWLEANVDIPDYMRMGGGTATHVCVDGQQYAEAIVDGARAAGLEVS